MRILDRYLLRELLFPLVFCLSGFLIFWITSDLISELDDYQELNMSAADVFYYYLLRSPEFLAFVLPMALLLALLYALTNHARHHELTAIRAAGVSLWRLCAPHLAVGLVCSVFLFLLNELWVPYSVDAAAAMKSRRDERSAGAVSRNWQTNLFFVNTRDHRRWQIGAYNRETYEMINPLVDWNLPGGAQQQLLAARAARVDGVWTFYDAHILTHHSPTSTVRDFAAVRPMPEFTETPELIRAQIRISGQSIEKTAKKAEIPLRDILGYLQLNPALTEQDADWLYTQLHGRLAAPWTCLVVVLIAIPFGAPSGRRNVFVGVASSIFIVFVYFILSQLGMALGTSGYLPSWLAAWFPNVSFGLTGIWLTSRVR